MWKKIVLKNCRRKLESSFSHSFPAIFSSLVMQRISQVCFEKKKCLRVAGFFQSGAIYATITHDPRSEFNQQKSECSEHQRSWGDSGGSLRPQRGH